MSSFRILFTSWCCLMRLSPLNFLLVTLMANMDPQPPDTSCTLHASGCSSCCSLSVIIFSSGVMAICVEYHSFGPVRILASKQSSPIWNVAWCWRSCFLLLVLPLSPLRFVVSGPSEETCQVSEMTNQKENTAARQNEERCSGKQWAPRVPWRRPF